MADNIPDKHHKKRRSYFGMVFSRTREEMEIGELVQEMAGGAVTVFLASTFHYAQQRELPELLFFALIGGIAGPVVGFLFRLVFVTPARMHRELGEKLEISESKLNEFQTVKSLEVGALPPKQMLDRPRSVYACEIFIRNDNQATSGVKLKLLGISPAFQTRDASIARYPLSAISFWGNDSAAIMLNPGETTTVRIFIVERDTSGITLQFATKWKWASEFENLFSIQYQNSVPLEYVLTFETSAVGIKASPTQFKMTFYLDPKKPPFALEKI
jgi:hypothetical protein